MEHETILKGGRSNTTVVKIGDTVHRNVGENSEFVHQLLKLLEEKGFQYAPKFLGIDEQGREILKFIDGDVPHIKITWPDDTLVKITRIIKEFHDATAGSDLAGNGEVVCHRDIAPWNIVIKDNIPVGLIDFDGASPGKRIEDLAYFLWTFLEIGNDAILPSIQASKIKMICDAYGCDDGMNLIDAILEQQNIILEMRKKRAQDDVTKEARDFSALKVLQISSEIEWVKKNKALLVSKI